MLQVFYWGQAAGFSNDGKQQYCSFSLNGIDYAVGDAVTLFPEDESQQHFLGRLDAAFIDHAAADPHAIQVSWYERRASQEVIELGETDVNPIGCISGKVHVFHCSGLYEAQGLARNLDQEWFYCKSSGETPQTAMCPVTAAGRKSCQGHDTTRSTHKRLPLQNQLEDADYSEEEGAVQQGRHSRQEAAPKRQRQGSASAQSLDSLQEVEPDEPPKRRNPPAQRSAPAKAAPGALLGGRVCVQCNATQTPQWREGPAGESLVAACMLDTRLCIRFTHVGVEVRSAAAGTPRAGGPAGERCCLGGEAAHASMVALCTRIARGRKDAGKESSGLGSMDAPGDAYAGDLATARPVRQAALLSATRTAEYARTGVFPTSGSLRGEDRADECAAASAAQQQQRAGQWDHRDQEHLEEEEPEGEEAEDEGGGDSYAAAVAAVDTVARISSGSEPISPHRPSPHNHPQITHNADTDDNHFSLSACAEEDFCPHFDVDTYQSVFFAPPFDTLKAAALPEDALVRLHTVGDSAPEVLAPLCSMPRVGAVAHTTTLLTHLVTHLVSPLVSVPPMPSAARACLRHATARLRAPRHASSDAPLAGGVTRVHAPLRPPLAPLDRGWRGPLDRPFNLPQASSAVLHPEAVHATNTCSTAAAAAAAAGPPAAESSAPPVPAPSSGRPSLAPATAAAAAAAAGTQQEHDSTRLPTTLAAAGAREADDADQATHASSGPCPVGIAARRVGGEAEDAGCAHHVSSRTR
ncbi:MAG: hypothetical protein WDW38_009642 [Sanguina aurantia]